MSRKHVGACGRKADEARRTFVVPVECNGGCGRLAPGDAGPLTYCHSCWAARRAGKLIRNLTASQAESILRTMEKLQPHR